MRGVRAIDLIDFYDYDGFREAPRIEGEKVVEALLESKKGRKESSGGYSKT